MRWQLQTWRRVQKRLRNFVSYLTGLSEQKCPGVKKSEVNLIREEEGGTSDRPHHR